MKRFSALAGLAASDLAISFGLQTFVLLTVGIGAQTDAFFAGQAPPLVLLAILMLPVQRAVVVAYAASPADRLPALRLIAATGVGTGLVLLLLCAFAPLLIAFAYRALPEAARATAVDVLRIQSLAIMIMSANLVMLALNQLSGRFLRCELSVLTSSIIGAIAVLSLISHLGVLAAAYGQIVKAIVNSAFLYWMLRGTLTWGPPPWKELASVVRPLVTAGAITKLAPLIDRSIASAAPSGSMTVLAFAQSIYLAANGIAERAIVAPRLPALKRNTASTEPMAVTKLLAAAGPVIVVGVVGCVVLASHLDFVLQYVPIDTLHLLAGCLIALAGFPIASLVVQWIAAAVVIFGRADLSARIVTWGFIVGVALKYLGFHLGGIYGLGIGISVYYLLNAGAFLVLMRRLTRSTPTGESTSP